RGGQHPNWDEELRFPIYETAEEEPTKIEGKGDGDAPSPGLPPKDGAKATKRTMHLSCYAEDFLKPDLIGETTVDLTRALTKGEMDEYFTLMSKQRHCGEVYLEITYWSEVRVFRSMCTSRLQRTLCEGQASAKATSPATIITLSFVR
ncbi:hypothetical protein M407DRAFT_67509, partial [Tulasnella calospora MUT 4182]